MSRIPGFRIPEDDLTRIVVTIRQPSRSEAEEFVSNNFGHGYDQEENERHYEYHHHRHHDREDEPGTPSPEPYSNSSASLICTHCNKSGHTIDVCWKLNTKEDRRKYYQEHPEKKKRQNKRNNLNKKIKLKQAQIQQLRDELKRQGRVSNSPEQGFSMRGSKQEPEPQTDTSDSMCTRFCQHSEGVCWKVKPKSSEGVLDPDAAQPRSRDPVPENEFRRSESEEYHHDLAHDPNEFDYHDNEQVKKQYEEQLPNDEWRYDGQNQELLSMSTDQHNELVKQEYEEDIPNGEWQSDDQDQGILSMSMPSDQSNYHENGDEEAPADQLQSDEGHEFMPNDNDSDQLQEEFVPNPNGHIKQEKQDEELVPYSDAVDDDQMMEYQFDSSAEINVKHEVDVTVDTPEPLNVMLCTHCGKSGHTFEMCWRVNPKEKKRNYFKDHPDKKNLRNNKNNRNYRKKKKLKEALIKQSLVRGDLVPSKCTSVLNIQRQANTAAMKSRFQCLGPGSSDFHLQYTRRPKPSNGVLHSVPPRNHELNYQHSEEVTTCSIDSADHNSEDEEFIHFDQFEQETEEFVPHADHRRRGHGDSVEEDVNQDYQNQETSETTPAYDATLSCNRCLRVGHTGASCSFPRNKESVRNYYKEHPERKSRRNNIRNKNKRLRSRGLLPPATETHPHRTGATLNTILSHDRGPGPSRNIHQVPINLQCRLPPPPTPPLWIQVPSLPPKIHLPPPPEPEVMLDDIPLPPSPAPKTQGDKKTRQKKLIRLKDIPLPPSPSQKTQGDKKIKKKKHGISPQSGGNPATSGSNPQPNPYEAIMWMWTHTVVSVPACNMSCGPPTTSEIPGPPPLPRVQPDVPQPPPPGTEEIPEIPPPRNVFEIPEPPPPGVTDDIPTPPPPGVTDDIPTPPPPGVTDDIPMPPSPAVSSQVPDPSQRTAAVLVSSDNNGEKTLQFQAPAPVATTQEAKVTSTSASTETEASDPILTCSHCQKVGHTIEMCFKLRTKEEKKKYFKEHPDKKRKQNNRNNRNKRNNRKLRKAGLPVP